MSSMQYCFNDPISVDQEYPDEHSSSMYMYEKLVQEGHDARIFRFAPSENIQGGHSKPRNFEYWQVGCLGITTPCTKVKNKHIQKQQLTHK